MVEYIHALMIQQCSPIFSGDRLGLNVLKHDYYYQKHNHSRPYFMIPFARGD